MTAMTTADRQLTVDAEGFLQDPSQWTETVGEEIAR